MAQCDAAALLPDLLISKLCNDNANNNNNKSQERLWVSIVTRDKTMVVVVVV